MDEGPGEEAGTIEVLGQLIDAAWNEVGEGCVEIVEDLSAGVVEERGRLVGGVAEEALGIDREPGLAVGREDVGVVEVAVEEDGGRGRREEIGAEAEGSIDEGRGEAGELGALEAGGPGGERWQGFDWWCGALAPRWTRAGCGGVAA